MYRDLFGGNSYRIFAKIMRCILWTPEYNTTFFAHRPICMYHKWW